MGPLLAEGGGVERLRVRGEEADLRFHPGREPTSDVVKEMVKSVPGELSFQADGREGLGIRLRVSAAEETVEAVAVLLRAACASATFAVSHSLN